MNIREHHLQINLNQIERSQRLSRYMSGTDGSRALQVALGLGDG